MFGLQVDWYKELAKFVSSLPNSGADMDGYEREIALREFYNEQSRIVSSAEFDDPNQPYVLVKMTNAEGLREAWPLRNRIRQFKIYEIQKHYGYNLSEFLELPHPLVEVILEEQRYEEEKLRANRRRIEEEEKRKAMKGYRQDNLETPKDFNFMFRQ